MLGPMSMVGGGKLVGAFVRMCICHAHGYIGWEQFMENQRRLENNINRYEAGHSGVPRKGAALLQGIAVCVRCGRRMSLRYSGPAGNYPVYTCRADRGHDGGPLCQEVRALPVDARVESILLEALTPDRIAIAVAALGQMEEEARQLERQWALRRERARYEAERARRQYDAVEPENRLVARSLERGWEEKLRAAETIEQDYERWRSDEPLVLSEADRDGLLALGENLPGIWHAHRSRRPSERASCASLSARSFSTRNGCKDRSGSRSCGKRERRASTLSKGAFTCQRRSAPSRALVVYARVGTADHFWPT